MIRVPKHKEVRVRQEGTRVSLIVDGREVLSGHWRQADELAKALVAKARAAEELEKHEAIAHDHAILMRAGAPFGLTNTPWIRDLAARIAAWDTRLRRFMPGGVRSQEHVGTPTIITKDTITKDSIQSTTIIGRTT